MCLDVSFITKDNTNQKNTHFIATVLFSQYQRISLRKSISIVSLDKISLKKDFHPKMFSTQKHYHTYPDFDLQNSLEYRKDSLNTRYRYRIQSSLGF